MPAVMDQRRNVALAPRKIAVKSGLCYPGSWVIHARPHRRRCRRVLYGAKDAGWGNWPHGALPGGA